MWGDAQRKERVGCRDVYKEELTGALSPRLAQTRSLARSDFTAEVEEQIGKRAKQDLSNHLSSSRTLRTEYLTALTLIIEFHIFYFLFASSVQKLVETADQKHQF